MQTQEVSFKSTIKRPMKEWKVVGIRETIIWKKKAQKIGLSKKLKENRKVPEKQFFPKILEVFEVKINTISKWWANVWKLIKEDS